MAPSRRELPQHLQHESFAPHDLRTLGVSIERLRRADIEHPFHGVSAHRVDLSDLVQRAVALTRRRDMPPFAFSHLTAAHLLGLPLPLHAARVDLQITVAHPARAPRLARVDAHAFRHPPKAVRYARVVAASSGEVHMLPVLRDDWLIASLATQLTLDDLVAVVDAVQYRASSQHGASDEFWAAQQPSSAGTARNLDLAGALTPGRRGSTLARRALALSNAGARSRPETLLRLLIQRAGFPEPVVGHAIFGTSWKATPDLAWPAYAVLLEYEGDHHRTNARQFRHDIRRFERYLDRGWSASRVTRQDLFEHTAELVTRVENRLRRAGWAPARSWRSRPVPPFRP